MNDQTIIPTHQNEKFKFPIAAILLTLYAAFEFFFIILQIYTYPFTGLLFDICIIALCVTMYAKKPNLAIIPAGVLTILEIIFLIDLINFSHEDHVSVIDYIIRIAYILVFASIALLSLSHIIDLQRVKKILLVVFCVSVAIVTLDYAFWTVYDLITDSYIDFPYILKDIPFFVGLILTGVWLADPYKRPAVSARTTETCESNDNYTSLGLHIVLLLCTFGIWQLIWTYKTTRFTNQAIGEEMRSPTSQLLLCMFVPFYSLVWTYKTAKRIDIIAYEKGISSELATICLILAFFIGIVPPILMQEKINSIIVGNLSPKRNDNSIPETIEKFKELLDKGIITQEEFDIKKKELLGL